jgi:hypothetical protein
MAMFRSNGAALLVLFEILQERLSACGDRPYPTNNVRSASQFFGAFCSGRVNTSFTAQTFALACELCQTDAAEFFCRTESVISWIPGP